MHVSTVRITASVLLGLVAIGAASCRAGLTLAQPVVTTAGVRFTFDDPEARRVAVAGSFNGWSATAHPLTLDASSRIWIAVVALPPGEHRFMYVVNGTEWVSPPLAEDYEDDGFGSKNGVVVVRP